MNELQSAILKKIGNYGDAIADISNELQATQESFSKLVNPLLDEKRKTKSIKKGKKTNNSSRKESSSGSFEDYFR